MIFGGLFGLNLQEPSENDANWTGGGGGCAVAETTQLLERSEEDAGGQGLVREVKAPGKIQSPQPVHIYIYTIINININIYIYKNK